MALGLTAGAVRSWAAPAFILDGRIEELDARIVAEDADGRVSALDVLFYLDMTRNPWVHLPAEAWLAEPATIAPASQEALRASTELYLAIRSLARQGTAAALPAAHLARLELTALKAAWVDQVVRPAIRVTPTDVHHYYISNPEQYAAPPRLQVRYIFLPVRDLSSAEETRAGEASLGALRDRIADGEISFEEAARRFSQAPSAAQGGLLPEFAPGTHFAEFERQAFGLRQPRTMSPVFVGNEGVYLLELVRREEPSRTPVVEVEKEIAARLAHEHVRSYYYLFLNRLARKTFIRDLAWTWEGGAGDGPIAMVGDRRLSRDEILRLNPAVINAGYEIQWGAVFQEAAEWIEGELIRRDLTKRAPGPSRFQDQARRIAREILTAEPVLLARAGSEGAASVEAALRTLGKGEEEAPGLPEARVVAVTLRSTGDGVTEIGREEFARRTLARLEAVVLQGRLPTRPEPTEFAETLLTAAARRGEAGVLDAIDDLEKALEQSPWEGVKISLRHLGWKSSLTGLAWHPSLAWLEPGKVSPPQPMIDRVEHYVVVERRFNPESPLLEVPLLIRIAAFERLKRIALEEEVERVRAQRPLRSGLESVAGGS